YGGSLMPLEVIRAMAEANDQFVDMYELNEAAGKRIAEVMKTEAGLGSAGSFSAMLLGAAACLTGKDPAKITALPHPTWPRRECLILKSHRVVYDRAYRAAGMTIIELETKEQLVNAISEKTAMIAGLASAERSKGSNVVLPEELVKIAKSKRIPFLIDAASQLPPVLS